MKYTTILIAICSSLAFVSCEKKSAPQPAQSSEVSHAFDAIRITSAPANAKPIADARQMHTPGQAVTLKGKVIGSKSPFVEGRAMVILGDPDKLTSCDIRHGDRCPTPWDVCCDDHDDVKNFTVTIQVLGEDGKLIKHGLKGVHGIKELSQLIVTGTVAEGSNADNLLINATGIYVQP